MSVFIKWAWHTECLTDKFTIEGELEGLKRTMSEQRFTKQPEPVVSTNNH